MKNFEQLLEETLRDVREAQPRQGVEARIMARVAAEAQPVSRWWLLSGAIAAGLLVAVLVHPGTRSEMIHPLAPAPMVSSSTGCPATQPACLSANGATHTSLGRRPRNAPHKNESGLKARYIGVTPRLQTLPVGAHPDRSPRSRLPRNALLHIAPIAIAPLRMEQIELASLTLKNRNERGETQ